MKPKLTIVMGVLNQFELSDISLNMMVANIEDKENVEVLVIDNGSDMPFKPTIRNVNFQVVRNEKNTGNYPLFKQALQYASGEIIAFFHSDVFVYQKGWEQAVISQFEANEKLGLIGFIGSTEIDNWGGRGGGTHSNMQGREITDSDKFTWKGSEAKIHGKQDAGFIIDGSVVDGCVMIFRKSVLEQIEHKAVFPPHHFYDRLMSVQVIEAGYKVGILGIQFDHVSGQVANHEQKWQDTSKEWFYRVQGILSPEQWAETNAGWVNTPNQPSHGKIPDQWDYTAYLEAERLFLQEYRDLKHLVPLYMGKPIK